MFGKRKNTPSIENAVAKGINFEVSIADLAKRSEKRAWTVAWIAVFIVIVMLGGLIYVLPLKKEVPYLIMADAFTGQATVATLRGDFSSPNSITQSEALNRSNIAQYIIGRESYDSSAIVMRDWRLISSMSSPNVRAGYEATYATTNAENPFKVYGKDRAIRVEILTMQFTPIRGTGENARKGADIRFQRRIYNKKDGVTEPLDSKVARLEFTYKSLKMDEKDRYLNPLGFQVTDYTIDIDYAKSPVVEIPATSQQPVSAYPVQPGVQPYPGQIPGQPVQAVPGQPQPLGYPAATPGFGEGVAPAPAPPSQAAVPASTVPVPQQQAPAVQAPNQVNGVGNR